jgi:drug/metabolite transporter (DMT)-like permease
MEHFWVFISLFAVIFQVSRNILMKQMKSKMDDEAIMLARFAVSAPFALLWLVCLSLLGYAMPQANWIFILYVIIASAFQIAGGLLFLRLFGRRNFVIGVTYARMDAMMAALFGAIIFSEFVSVGALFAIILSFSGIVMIAMAEEHLEPKNLFKRIFTPSAIMGAGSGVMFGISSLFIRHSILALEGGEFFVRSTYSLFCMQVLQAFAVFVIVYIKNKPQIVKIVRSGYGVYLVGLTNSVSSFCWYVAFSLTNAAHVSMVGQVEILFSVFVTHKVFKEKTCMLEILGMTVVVGSILLLVYFK